jgi:hypothetical protein
MGGAVPLLPSICLHDVQRERERERERDTFFFSFFFLHWHYSPLWALAC